MKEKLGVRELEMEDPTFEAGSIHTASVQVKNPTGKDFTYTMELYLDVTKVASTSKSATIPAGSTQTISFSVTMPATEGTWEVYFDVSVDGQVIAHYKGSVDIVTVISPDLTIIDITWE